MSYKPSVHIKELPRAPPREPSPEPEPTPCLYAFVTRSASANGRAKASMHLKKLPSSGPAPAPEKPNLTGIHLKKVARAEPSKEVDPPRGSRADLAARRAQRAASVRRRRLNTLGMSVHSVPGKSPRNKAFGRSPRTRSVFSPRVAGGVLRGPGRPSKHNDPDKRVNIVTPRSITVPGSVTPLQVPDGLSAPDKPFSAKKQGLAAPPARSLSKEKEAAAALEALSLSEENNAPKAPATLSRGGRKEAPAAPLAPPAPPSVLKKAPGAPPPPPPLGVQKKATGAAAPAPPPPPPPRS